MTKFRKIFLKWFKDVQKIEEDFDKVNRIKFLTPTPVVPQTNKFMWLDFREWQIQKAWESYRELRMYNYIAMFGIGTNVDKVSQDEFDKEFTKYYKHLHPENYKLLNLEKDGK